MASWALWLSSLALCIGGIITSDGIASVGGIIVGGLCVIADEIYKLRTGKE